MVQPLSHEWSVTGSLQVKKTVGWGEVMRDNNLRERDIVYCFGTPLFNHARAVKYNHLWFSFGHGHFAFVEIHGDTMPRRYRILQDDR